MVTKRLFLALGVVALTVPAAAQRPSSAPAAKPQDPEAFAAALALFDAEDLEEQLRSSMVLMAEEGFRQQIDLLEAGGDSPPHDLVDRIGQVVASEAEILAKTLLPTFRAEAAAVYAAHFTADELRQLKELSAHPVMQKMDRLTPVLMVEISRIGHRAAAERIPVIQRRMERMLEEWIAEQPEAQGTADS